MLSSAVNLSFPCDVLASFLPHALPLDRPSISYSQLEFCPQLTLRSEDMKTWRRVRRRILGGLQMPDRQKWSESQGFKDSFV